MNWSEVVRSRLPRHPFSRGVVLIAGGTALSQSLGILVSPLLTRLFKPADFGLYAVYLSILGILSAVASLRYEQAIPLADSEERSVRVVALSLVVVGGTVLLSGAGLAAFGARLVAEINSPDLRPYLGFVPFGLAAAGIFTVMNFWLIREKAYTLMAKSRLAQGISLVAVQVTAGVLGIGPLGLIVGYTAGHIAGGAVAVRTFWKKRSVEIRRVTWSGIGREAGRYRKFPLYSGTSSLINSSAGNLPALLLAAFYGPQTAGWFGLGQRLMGGIKALAVDAVARVYIGEASPLVFGDPRRLHRLYHWALFRLLALAAVPVTVVVVLGPSGFAFIFGEEWRTMGLYLRYFSLAFWLQIGVGALSPTLMILERQRTQLVYDIVRLVLVIASIGTAELLSWSAAQAVLILSLTNALTFLALILITSRILTARVRKWKG